MIGLIALVAIAIAGRFLNWPKGLTLGLLAALWGGLVLVTAPGIGAPGLAALFGGDFRIWVLLGPFALLVFAYRKGLRYIRAKAAPPAVADPAAPGAFRPAELQRYSRHILLREIGGPGQQRLKAAKVLVIGAGGLGGPILQYLGAAGVGQIGVIDDDLVDSSNLQRQVIHSDAALGMPKVFSAAQALSAQNPFIQILPFNQRLTADNAAQLIGDFDLVLDGSDNFDTRYLVNRICCALDKPLIAGAMTQWEGQLSLYHPAGGGACYECIFPERPNADLVPACSGAGVAGPLPGVIGSLMALEAVKFLTGAGQGLKGRLMLYDGLWAETQMIAAHRRADCSCCGRQGPAN